MLEQPNGEDCKINFGEHRCLTHFENVVSNLDRGALNVGISGSHCGTDIYGENTEHILSIPTIANELNQPSEKRLTDSHAQTITEVWGIREY